MLVALPVIAVWTVLFENGCAVLSLKLMRITATFLVTVAAVVKPPSAVVVPPSPSVVCRAPSSCSLAVAQDLEVATRAGAGDVERLPDALAGDLDLGALEALRAAVAELERDLAVGRPQLVALVRVRFLERLDVQGVERPLERLLAGATGLDGRHGRDEQGDEGEGDEGLQKGSTHGLRVLKGHMHASS